jgi:hypothetical protein
MKLARDLERRLEQLVEGVAGKVFRGAIQPAELAARLARESDLTRREGSFGPVAPNHFTVHLNPGDTAEPSKTSDIAAELEGAVEVTAWSRGWRLEGPAEVVLEPNSAVSAGMIRIKAAERPGARAPWGTLVGSNREWPITVNRCLVGRSSESDITLSLDSISRQHALIWREDDRAWVWDLESANGTFVDGVPAVNPIATDPGQRVTFGAVPYILQIG